MKHACKCSLSSGTSVSSQLKPNWPKYSNIHRHLCLIKSGNEWHYWVINHESEITRVNITGVRACKPILHLDSKPLYFAHVKRGSVGPSMQVKISLYTQYVRTNISEQFTVHPLEWLLKMLAIIVHWSWRVRRFDCKGLHLLRNSSVTDEDLHSWNVLLAFKYLLCVGSSTHFSSMPITCLSYAYHMPITCVSHATMHTPSQTHTPCSLSW